MQQPLQDVLSVPRRALDVEDYIDIMRRHKSWIIGPAFAALVIAVVAAFLWPDTYVSEAVLQVVPPQVSEKYVPSNINSEMTQRINAMAQKILARDYMTNVINTNSLYPTDRQRKPLEDVLETMRKAIKISPVVSLQQQAGRNPISAFRISFEYSNRFIARKVTQQLVSGFIDENIRTLAQQSAATTDFLKGQWDDAKKRLDDLENRMAEFRQRNAGRLPDQLQANLQTLRTLETQLAGVNEAINRIGQERLLLESQLRIYRDQLASLGQSSDRLSTQVRDQQLAQTERQIVTLETGISALKERYKDTHPDVRAAEAQLAMLRKKRDSLIKEEKERLQENKAVEGDPKLDAVNDRTAKQIEAIIARIQSEIQVKGLELEERSKTQKKITEMIDAYNARVDASPLTEKEHTELTRDLHMARTRYEELNAKKALSEAATTLENQGRGEQLALLDQASLPERPTKPNRWLIVGAGLAIGLMLGAFIAGARELKDASLKNLKDARAYTNLPVLGTIPLLENDLVVRRKRRLAWLGWSAACIVGVLAMTSSIYYHFATKV